MESTTTGTTAAGTAEGGTADPRRAGGVAQGVDPSTLSDSVLLKELENVHRTRHDTFLHGSSDALAAHNTRTAQLEGEYLRRNPRRSVASGRTRAGARARES